VDLSDYKTRVYIYPLGKTQNISFRDVWISLCDELHEFVLRNTEFGSSPIGDQFLSGQTRPINSRSISIEFINDADRIGLTMLLQHVFDFVSKHEPEIIDAIVSERHPDHR